MSSLPGRALASLVILGLLACCLLSLARASQRLTFALERLDGAGIAARDIALSLDLFDGSLHASIARLDIAGESFEDIVLDCPKGRLQTYLIACDAGDFKAGSRRLGSLSGRLAFAYASDSGQWWIELKQTRVLGGRLGMRIDGAAGAPARLHLRLRRVPARRIAGLANLPGLTPGSGHLDLNLDLGRHGTRWTLDARLGWAGLGFEYGEGFIGDSLDGVLRIEAKQYGQRWRGRFDATLSKGELLMPWAYVSAQDRPLRIAADVRMDPGRGRVVFSDGKLDYLQATVAWDADLRWREAHPLHALHLNANGLAVGRWFEAVLQPVHPDLSFQPSGRLDMGLAIDAAGLSALNLRLSAGGVRERDARYRVDGVNGALSWRRGSGGEARLRWGSASLYQRVPIGPAMLRLKLSRDAIQAVESIRIPVFDGELVLDDLAVSGLDKTVPDIAFNAVLTPIDLRKISEALGWPLLKGHLSAVIPGVRLRNGQLEVAGAWLVRAFDGRLLIRHLRLRDPFGALPVLEADIELRGLNLRELTETFSFGKITGTLDGDIRGLRLEAWKPVAFDAWLRTPKDDPRPHRISQRAVENISDLGGSGMSGALSRSFLSLFEDFGYARLGIGCRLHDGICELRGIDDTGKGYYLVEGAGIPRIDIKGFNRRADWELLVRKLIEISNAPGEPIITE